MVVWKVHASNRFLKYQDDLPDKERNTLDHIVIDLGNSPDSRRLADENVTTREHGRVYMLRLSRSYRLAYRVYFREKIIEMVSVGDHKEVYGKD